MANFKESPCKICLIQKKQSKSLNKLLNALPKYMKSKDSYHLLLNQLW